MDYTDFMDKTTTALPMLRADIEAALGHALTLPRHFSALSDTVFRRLGVMLSRTTLMRLWGYVDEPVTPRRATLDILSRFLGYDDWHHYLAARPLAAAEAESNPLLMARHISVSDDLEPGQRLRLTWHPGRVCVVEYQGGLTFAVVSSERTRLQPGDTFRCALITDGEPLYLTHLLRAGEPPVSYVCGRHHGVRWSEV